jgi:hypothetical protein
MERRDHRLFASIHGFVSTSRRHSYRRKAPLVTATTIEAVEEERPGGDPPPAEPEVRRAGWTRLLPMLGLAALAIPVVTAAVVALTQLWLPPSDHGIIEVRVADVGGPMTPLVGAYSRLGWNHPGPMAFWLLALPYRLLGGSARGLLLGALVINTAAIIGCLVLARRRGGTTLMVLTGLVMAVMIRGYGAAFLFHIWNPDMPAFPTAFLILATWSVIEGDLRVLPAVVAVSCFAWQTHLGYLPVTGGLAVIALVATVVHLVKERGEARSPAGSVTMWRRPTVVLTVTALTALVCLAPLLIEQATTRPGNLRLIVESFVNPTDPSAGLGRAARVSAKHLAPLGTWVTGDDPAELFTGAAKGGNPLLLLYPLLAGVLAAAAAWRARAGDALRFVALTAMTVVVAFAAVSRTTGPPYNYLFNWLRPVSALFWAAVIWAVLRSLMASRWSPQLQRAPVRLASFSVVAVAILGFSVSSLTNATALEFQENQSAVRLRALVPGTLAAVRGQRQVFLRTVGGWCAGEIGNGLAAQMREHGTDVAVVEPLGTAYGKERVRTDVGPTVELFCGPVAKDTIKTLPIRPVAAFSILTDAEEAELAALQEQFRAQLRDGGRDDLLKSVDNHTFPMYVREGVPGMTFDQQDVDRFDLLMNRAQASASVFFRPYGPNAPP